jgi:hypothetical protein
MSLLWAQPEIATGLSNITDGSLTEDFLEDPFNKPMASETDDPTKSEPTQDEKSDSQDDSDGKKVTLKPYGFIKNNVFWDSRQIFGFRDNDVLFWPLRYRPDVTGRDINARPQFNILPIETLVGMTLSAPDIVQDVKAVGLIECDFVGFSEVTINLFRMRLAYVELEFERINAKLLTGQFWHPLFNVDCFPHTVSYNFGMPFNPSARQPQVRFLKQWEHSELMLTAITERDFTSYGPPCATKPHCFLKIYDTIFKRNSAVPDLDLQYVYRRDCSLVGFNLDFKRIIPRIVTDKNVKVAEYNNSFVGQIFATFIPHNNWRASVKLLFEQNGTANILPGGYAIRTIDPLTDARTYANINWITAWLDTSYLFCDHGVELGVFLAAGKNFGSTHRLFIDCKTKQPVIYGDGGDIAHLTRISPRLFVNREPFKFGLEIEITTAAFGTLDEYARVYNTRAVTGVRLLLATYYVF